MFNNYLTRPVKRHIMPEIWMVYVGMVYFCVGVHCHQWILLPSGSCVMHRLFSFDAGNIGNLTQFLQKLLVGRATAESNLALPNRFTPYGAAGECQGTVRRHRQALGAGQHTGVYTVAGFTHTFSRYAQPAVQVQIEHTGRLKGSKACHATSLPTAPQRAWTAGRASICLLYYGILQI